MNYAGPVALAAAVAQFFQANGVSAKVDFGWRARYTILNQGPGGANRVVFMPGKVPPDVGVPKSIEAGELGKPQQSVGFNPRPLMQWRQIITVSIWGVAGPSYQGGAGLGDEASQYAAAVDLLEATVQAVHGAVFVDPAGGQFNVGLANVVWEDLQWVQPPNELGFGRELFVYMQHSGPLFDLPKGTATPQPAINRNPAT